MESHNNNILLMPATLSINMFNFHTFTVLLLLFPIIGFLNLFLYTFVHLSLFAKEFLCASLGTS